MTRQTVIRRLRRHQPQDEQDLLEHGIPLEYVGNGAFRYAYRIPGTSLIVKIPKRKNYNGKYNEVTFDDCRDHARAEHDAYINVKHTVEFKALRKYLPEIVYFDHESGLLVMKEYKTRKWSRSWDAKVRELDDMVQSITGSEDTDCHTSNIAVDERGRPVIIDLGMLLEA